MVGEVLQMERKMQQQGSSGFEKIYGWKISGLVGQLDGRNGDESDENEKQEPNWPLTGTKQNEEKN